MVWSIGNCRVFFLVISVSAIIIVCIVITTFRRPWDILKQNYIRIETTAAAVLFFLTALLFTWPLSLHITAAIPAGSEPPSVAMFQLFTAEWTGLVMDSGMSYWNAPYFYPFQGVFAWCEPQLFNSLLIWLIAKLTGYIAAYNIVSLLFLTGFGLAGYLTGRLLTEDRVAALLGGMWLSGGAYVLQQLCSLPLISAAIPFGCLYAGFLFVKNKRLKAFWFSAFCYGLSWFSCKQLAVYLTLFLPVALCPFLFPLRRPPRAVTRLSGHFLIVLVMAVALIVPYSLRQYSFTRDMGFAWSVNNRVGILEFRQLLTPAYGHWLTDRILHWQWYSWDLGIAAVMIVCSAVCFGMRPRNFDIYQKKLVYGIVGMICAALLAGIKPAMGLYQAFFSNFPGLSLIRIPARSAVFAIFGVAVLFMPAFAFLRNRISRPRLRTAITLAVYVFVFLEMWTMPVPLVYPLNETRGHRQVIDWLREHGKGYPLVELPMKKNLWSRDTELDAGAMLRMLRHRNPVVNGYESFSPVPFKQLRTALNVDPAGSGKRYLEAYGVRLVLVHTHLLDTGKAVLPLFGRDTVVYRDSGHAIYAFPEIPDAETEDGLFPETASFRGSIPHAGGRYSLRLRRVPGKAVLILPGPDRHIDLTWHDTAGRKRVKRVRLTGSVILDAGQKEFSFRLAGFPADERTGEAVLVSAKEEK